MTKYPIVEITSPLSYEPQRHYSRRFCITKVDIDDWRARPGYPTYEVTKSTIQNTTHRVNTLQSETNDHMKDHYNVRVWSLRPRHIDDVMYSDIFFSSICSIRGYKCSKFLPLNGLNMKRLLLCVGSQDPDAYEDEIRYVGAPKKIVTNNAQVLTDSRWTSINRRYCISTGLTVYLYQHQNYCEMTGGV